jgi:hypothetical protein
MTAHNVRRNDRLLKNDVESGAAGRRQAGQPVRSTSEYGAG